MTEPLQRGLWVGLSGVILLLVAGAYLRLGLLDFDHKPAFVACGVATVTGLLVLFVTRRWARSLVGLGLWANAAATAAWLYTQGERWAFSTSFHYDDISYTLIVTTTAVAIARALLSTREARYLYGTAAEQSAMLERDALDRVWTDEAGGEDSAPGTDSSGDDRK